MADEDDSPGAAERLEAAADDVARTAGVIGEIDPHERVLPGTAIVAGLGLGGLGLLLGGVGAAVLPSALKDVARGRGDAWAGLAFTTCLFVLPGLFCLFVSARLLVSRGSGDLLPWWAWRIIAAAMLVAILAMVFVMAQGTFEAAAPTLFLGWLTLHAVRRSSRPAPPP